MSHTIEHPPVTPMPDSAAWARALKTVASQPLEFCPDFPAIAARHEAWWHRDIIDRPLLLWSRAADRSQVPRKHLDLLGDPERWLEATFADMRARQFRGDSLPNTRVDFGPVMTGGLMGAKTEFGSETTWTHAFINDDWSNAPQWRIDESNAFWRQFTALSTLAAAHAKGRYLVRCPDYGGSADVLLNLRGSEALCVDCLTQPDTVRKHTDAIYPVWHRAFSETYRRILAEGAGLIHWMGLWSNEPYMIPACDFNYLIGPKEFERLFLPDIARECATVGRAVFHLDGPGATRHLDALLEIPEIRAIQYVTGDGTPEALPWVDMFRRIQSKGRSLVITCLGREIPALLEQIEPEGVAFCPHDDTGMESILAGVCRRFGAGG